MDNLVNIKTYYDRSFGDRQRELYNYFTGYSVPIMSRVPISQAKASSHTNLHTDYFNDIVSLKVGYLGGNIKPSIDTDNNKVKELLKKFQMITSLDSLNSVRDAAICGLTHRLCYTDNGEFKIKNIPAWSVVYSYEHSVLEATKAYYYYETTDIEGKTVKHCDVYDSTNVTYFIGLTGTKVATQPKAGDNFNSNYIQKGDPQPHNFTELPIIPFQNNDFWFGDCEKSLGLMDVYDEVLSDASSEIKALRSAYLKLWGDMYTGLDSDNKPIDINAWMKQSGTMRFPIDENGNKAGDASFLEKSINDTAIENNLNRLRKSIYETSGSIDLQEITKAERIFSIRASMMRLENNCMTTERYFRSALTKMMRIWSKYINKFYNLSIGDYDVQWTFKRTFPRDIAAEATIISTLSPVIGLSAALTELGWENAKQIAKDVEYETNNMFGNVNNKETNDNDVNKEDIE